MAAAVKGGELVAQISPCGASIVRYHDAFLGGIYPGVLWSPLLAATEFFGGLLLIAGFLTRPAALAAAIVLITTVWVHWVPMGEGFSGAEFSILWSAVLLYFVVRGGNAHSVDARIGRQF